MSHCSYKIYLADMTNSRSYVYFLTFNNAKNTLSRKGQELSLLCKRIILQALPHVFTSRATNGAALFLVDKISLLIMVLTLGGRSYLNTFVTEEKSVPLSLLASSPVPPPARITFAHSIDCQSHFCLPA